MEFCANCSAGLQGPYCFECGEKRLSKHDLSVGHLASHALHDLTHFDSKIFRSIYLLLAKPGFLTAEFAAGRWMRYIKPTTVFVLVNLFFFFAKGGIMNWKAAQYIESVGPHASEMVAQRASERHVELNVYLKHFDEVAKEKQHSMFLFAIPVVALLSWVFFRHRYLAEHLVYSIHFHVFMLLFLTLGVQLLFRVILRPVVWAGYPQVVEYLAREPALNYWIAATLWAYHVFALRGSFSASWFRAIFCAAILVAGEAAFLLSVFRPLVFFWVYYTA